MGSRNGSLNLENTLLLALHFLLAQMQPFLHLVQFCKVTLPLSVHALQILPFEIGILAHLLHFHIALCHLRRLLGLKRALFLKLCLKLGNLGLHALFQRLGICKFFCRFLLAGADLADLGFDILFLGL